MHQDHTFTSKNILYFIWEIEAGGGGGRGGGGGVRTIHLTYLEFLFPFFLEFSLQSFLILKSIVR